MRALVTVFLVSLLAGTTLGLRLRPGVTLYIHDLVLVVLLVAKYHFRRVQAAKLKLLMPIMIFLFTAVASLFVNSSYFGVQATALSSLYLVRWFLYAEVYMLVATSRFWQFWIRMLYIVGVLFASLGLMQYFLYPDLRNLSYLGWDPHYFRLFSTLLDPNFAGAILVLGFLLGLYFWKEIRLRPALIMSQATILVALLLTYSRSSYLGFIVGVIVYAAIIGQKQLALGLLMLFFASISILPLRDMTILRLDRAETAIARLGNWQHGIELFSERPLLGWGFNTLRYVQAQKDWTDEGETMSRAAGGLDNSFLFLLATTGIVGLLSYLWILASMVGKLKNTNFGPVLIASIAGISVHSLFINSLFYPWVMIWAWILAGAAENEINGGI